MNDKTSSSPVLEAVWSDGDTLYSPLAGGVGVEHVLDGTWDVVLLLQCEQVLLPRTSTARQTHYFSTFIHLNRHL